MLCVDFQLSQGIAEVCLHNCCVGVFICLIAYLMLWLLCRLMKGNMLTPYPFLISCNGLLPSDIWGVSFYLLVSDTCDVSFYDIYLLSYPPLSLSSNDKLWSCLCHLLRYWKRILHIPKHWLEEGLLMHSRENLMLLWLIFQRYSNLNKHYLKVHRDMGISSVYK